MSVLSKKQTWLVGTPNYQLSYADRCIPGVLLGCADAARELLLSAPGESAFRRRFEAEYTAVLEALLNAGMPFRILNLHSADTPLGERLRAQGYPDFRIDTDPRGSTFQYPRDLLVYLRKQGIALVNKHWLRPGAGDRAGVSCWPSDWCEGGRVLASGNTLAVFFHPEKPGAPEQATLGQLRELGLKVVEIPAGIFTSMDGDGHATGLFYDHHIDRAAGLAAGTDGALHLILGPGYRTGPLRAPLDATASSDAVRRICDKAEITLHVLPDSSLPYAPSCVQSPEGVAVVSGGDDTLREMLAGIVGPDNVVTTGVPLTHFPVFASAGLHCLVTESPEFLLAPRGE